MAEKEIDLNALGQVLDTTFTRSSASSGPVMSTYSVKASFAPGDKPKVKVVYSCFVNMGRTRDLAESKAVYEKEGDSYIDAASKRIVKEYKELADGSIKLSRVDVGTSIEVVDLNVHNQKRTVLFRRIAFFDVK